MKLFGKELDKEDKILIGAGVLSIGLLGFMYWRKKKAEREATPLPKEIEETPPQQTEIPQAATPPVTIPKKIIFNKSKVLKRGSKGAEVRELQQKLGIQADGDFGPKTESALIKSKGVKSITLNQFEGKVSYNSPKAAPVVTTLKIPKPGAKLMAIKNDFNIFNAVKNADGTYANSGKSGTWTSFNYGEEVGIFKAARPNGQFLITRDGKFYYVNGANVKAFS